MQGLGYADGFFEDGEWFQWEDPLDEPADETTLQRLEREAALRLRYPNADIALIPYFRDLLYLAEAYHMQTGRHLQVHGDLGELFGAIEFGIDLHRNHARGSDGRLGKDFVEIKTITPFNSHDRACVDLRGHFSKLLIVRIDANFEVAGRMLDRKCLPDRGGQRLRLAWQDLPQLGATTISAA